jgi:hypothetical protein
MDDPKHVINKFVEELWNQRRLDVADAIFSGDCVTHQLRSGVPVDAVRRGPQAIKEHVMGWIASFPDLRFSIEQMLSEGDRVVMQLLMEGTTRARGWEFPRAARSCRYGCSPSTALCRARSSRTGCWWNRSASFSNLELSLTQQTWWATSCVSGTIVDI